MVVPFLIRPIDVEDFEAVSALLTELGNPARTADTRSAARTVFERHVADAQTMQRSPHPPRSG